MISHYHHHHHHRDSDSAQYVHRSASRTSSSVRLYVNSSLPNSPCASARTSLQCSRSPAPDEVVTTAAAAAAAERHLLPANELALPVSAADGRRSTSSYVNTLRFGERRMTQDNFLTSRRKVVRLLAAIVTSFALCMLPHHVRVQWQEWRRTASYSYEQMYIPPLTTLVFYVNSCLNPLLYALISNKFRQAFANLRCCRHADTAPPHLLPLAPVSVHRRPIVRCNSQTIDPSPPAD